MNAKDTVADLLRDAEHIAKANNFIVLAYLIGMALEHVDSDVSAPTRKTG